MKKELCLSYIDEVRHILSNLSEDTDYIEALKDILIIHVKLYGLTKDLLKTLQDMGTPSYPGLMTLADSLTPDLQVIDLPNMGDLLVGMVVLGMRYTDADELLQRFSSLSEIPETLQEIKALYVDVLPEVSDEELVSNYSKALSETFLAFMLAECMILRRMFVGEPKNSIEVIDLAALTVLTGNTLFLYMLSIELYKSEFHWLNKLLYGISARLTNKNRFSLSYIYIPTGKDQVDYFDFEDFLEHRSKTDDEKGKIIKQLTQKLPNLTEKEMSWLEAVYESEKNPHKSPERSWLDKEAAGSDS